MKCLKCGLENENVAQFCAGCGSKLTEQTNNIQ